MAAVPTVLDASLVKFSLAQAEDFTDVWQLLEEYFDAVHVVVRDDRDAVLKSLGDRNGGIWLAYHAGVAAGCIALRPLRSMSSETHRSSEIKRLYVRPAFRRMRIAAGLLAALESYALSTGIQTLYLDSKDDLREAHVFYQHAGYLPCERYNNNPQATLFMRKDLPLPIAVRDFRAGDEEAFWLLNEAWISKLFKLESKDIQTLRNPEKYILSNGGRVYMACRGMERVGCCALLNMGSNSYEVAKMGVAESERGQGIGRRLLDYVIQDATQLGIQRLYLETNHSLKNAIHLYESVGFRHLSADRITPSPYARADVYMEMLLS